MALMTPLPPTSMNVQVSGKQMAVGEALRTRVVDELIAAIGKYFERGGNAEVVVSKGRQGAILVEVRVTLATGQRLIASGQAGDAHSAFTVAQGKIESRIRRYKSRLTDHHPHAGASERATYTVLRSPEDEDDDIGEGDDWGQDGWGQDGSAGDGAPAAAIIAETEAQVRSMTVSMAVMELDLTEAPVVVFRNAAHGGFSVVYRRADGNIGWIDPERAAARTPGPKIPARAVAAG